MNFFFLILLIFKISILIKGKFYRSIILIIEYNINYKYYILHL